MKDISMSRWSAYDPFDVNLTDKKFVDMIITRHAPNSRITRIESIKTKLENICMFLWDKP